MKVYPSHRYHPTEGSKIVHSEAEDAALGPQWVHSPAEYGHETCPNAQPDAAIAAKREAYKAMLCASRSTEARKPGRTKKIEAKEGAQA